MHYVLSCLFLIGIRWILWRHTYNYDCINRCNGQHTYERLTALGSGWSKRLLNLLGKPNWPYITVVLQTHQHKSKVLDFIDAACKYHVYKDLDKEVAALVSCLSSWRAEQAARIRARVSPPLYQRLDIQCFEVAICLKYR